MALDLETLRAEIQTYLEASDIPVFFGYHRTIDPMAHSAWDVENHPDFREFLAAGRKAGAKLIVFTHLAFSLDQIDEAIEQLEASDLTREEKRNFETRLRQLQAYEGFTCMVELSFTLDAEVYVFERRTDWYNSLNDILAELDFATEEEEAADDDPLGGYFSKN
jgi:hypothetical protein